MTSGNDTTYRKHNSFVDLRHKQGGLREKVIVRIKLLQADPLRGDGLSTAFQGILEHALQDILADEEEASPCLRLTPSVIEEINTCTDHELPRYLVHRYRYEIYPQLGELDGYPPYLQIEPSSVCNYRCVFCFESDKSFTRHSAGFMGYMSFDLFQRIIDEAYGKIEFLSLASRGEPLLCPDIEKMLAYTRGKFLNLKLNTNASLLDESKCHALLQSGVKTLVFSADAASEPRYSQLRVGGKLEKVLANIERFQKIRVSQYPDANIITRVSGVKMSDQQNLDEMQSLWGALVDQVAFVSYNPWEDTYHRPVNEISQRCSDLWRRMFVWWDGKVNPCDVDYKSTLSVGNFNADSLGRIWRSVEYEALRGVHLTNDRQNKEPCRRCSVV
jgi:radical SAM protein with 4Fe4S-binding SPASM domain